jgi:electron transfer flavoprotein alpha subunit
MSGTILVVMEQRGGAWNRMSWETLAAAQQLARDLNQQASAAVVGAGIEGLADDLSSKQLEKAYAVEHPLLENYTPDAYAAAIRQLVDRAKPDLVLFPHSYQVRDFLPKLATALGRVFPADFAIDGIVRINQLGADIWDVPRDWIGLWSLALIYLALAIVSAFALKRRQAHAQA